SGITVLGRSVLVDPDDAIAASRRSAVLIAAVGVRGIAVVAGLLASRAAVRVAAVAVDVIAVVARFTGLHDAVAAARSRRSLADELQHVLVATQPPRSPIPDRRDLQRSFFSLLGPELETHRTQVRAAFESVHRNGGSLQRESVGVTLH